MLSKIRLILPISTKNVEKSREIREMRKSTIFRLCYTEIVKIPIKRRVNGEFLFILRRRNRGMRKHVSDRYLDLKSLKNARELGGIPLSGGRMVRKGLLIRAGRLSELSSEDRITLTQQWKLSEIIDLRNNEDGHHMGGDTRTRRFPVSPPMWCPSSPAERSVLPGKITVWT